MRPNPEQIKADIEVTRAELSRDVDALAETVRPGNVARRQKDKALSTAPQAARQGTQGNPLAAGLIALGVGWLAGSIVPATRAERQAAATLKEQAQPLAQEVSDMAKEGAQNLQGQAKEAVAQVKSTGTEAVQTVKEEGKTTSTDVAGSAKESAQNLRESRQSY